MSDDNVKHRVYPIAAVAPKDTDGTKGKNDQTTGKNEGGKENKLTTANALIELAVGSCEFFHDERGDGYALVTDNKIRRTLRLRSKAFRGWLAGTFYKTTQRAANNEALSTALSVLEAKAINDNGQVELSNRFAMVDSAIYIDLADKQWRAVKVTAAGWEILDKPSVLFRRYSHQQVLPDPVSGGKLFDIHCHLGIKSNDDKHLLEAYLVACAFSNVPRPAITFHGPQGASKTTTARCLKAITDPSLLGSVDLGKSPADLAQILDHHGVPCFDNLTSIPAWAADMLCRGISGGAFSKRELYSDDSDIILSFKRAIIITGINIPTHAPDLLDRLLLIELERITPVKRVDEVTFWALFDKEKPKLFGALLDAITGTLQHLPKIKLTRMARMADFTRIARAYAEYIGIGKKKMLAIIMRHTSRQTEEVLAADSVATAILGFIKEKGSWTGTATELLKLLNEAAPTPRPHDWPRQPNSLTKRMNTIHTTLNEASIRIVKDKGRNNGRIMKLEYKAISSSPSSSPSACPTHKDSAVDDEGKLSPVGSSGEDDACSVKLSSSVLSSPSKTSTGKASDDKDGKDDESDVLSNRHVVSVR